MIGLAVAYLVSLPVIAFIFALFQAKSAVAQPRCPPFHKIILWPVMLPLEYRRCFPAKSGPVSDPVADMERRRLERERIADALDYEVCGVRYDRTDHPNTWWWEELADRPAKKDEGHSSLVTRASGYDFITMKKIRPGDAVVSHGFFAGQEIIHYPSSEKYCGLCEDALVMGGK